MPPLPVKVITQKSMPGYPELSLPLVVLQTVTSIASSHSTESERGDRLRRGNRVCNPTLKRGRARKTLLLLDSGIIVDNNPPQ